MYDNFTCTTSKPRPLIEFPTPEELRAAYEKGMRFSLEAEAAKPLLTHYAGGEAIHAIIRMPQSGQYSRRSLKATTVPCWLWQPAREKHLSRSICNQGLAAFQNVFGADAADMSRRNPQKNARVLIAIDHECASIAFDVTQGCKDHGSYHIISPGFEIFQGALWEHSKFVGR